MTDEQLSALADWYKNEYRRRTEALKQGAGQYEWIAPDYRVTRTEIQSYAEDNGIGMDVNDWIMLFHYLNDDHQNGALHA